MGRRYGPRPKRATREARERHVTQWVKHDTPKPFGYLLTLDLYRCKSGVCDDLSACYLFMVDLVNGLGMTMQAPPFVFRSPAQYADKAGLSGWVPLIESGIQIHTLVPRDFISIDIYCCHEFEAGAVLEIAKKAFEPSMFEMNQIPRGLKYHEASAS
jgi:S-adenosylmethionine/arginine decarboxylase-like enzyme